MNVEGSEFWHVELAVSVGLTSIDVFAGDEAFEFWHVEFAISVDLTSIDVFAGDEAFALSFVFRSFILEPSSQ